MKKLSPRAARRELARSDAKFARDVERLYQLSPGGSPSRPIDLESASQVEIHASSIPCPRCQGALRVEDHVVESVGSARLRVAHLVCTVCGTKRKAWFRLKSALAN